jgi:hypothetical protein
MSWLGIVLIVLGIVLTVKVVGFALRLIFATTVLAGLCLVLGPRLGLPAAAL